MERIPSLLHVRGSVVLETAPEQIARTRRIPIDSIRVPGQASPLAAGDGQHEGRLRINRRRRERDYEVDSANSLIQLDVTPACLPQTPGGSGYPHAAQSVPGSRNRRERRAVQARVPPSLHRRLAPLHQPQPVRPPAPNAPGGPLGRRPVDPGRGQRADRQQPHHARPARLRAAGRVHPGAVDLAPRRARRRRVRPHAVLGGSVLVPGQAVGVDEPQAGDGANLLSV